MTTLRSYIDPDQQKPTGPTFFKTAQNENEIRCGICAEATYVDNETFRFVWEAIESGLENPFRCEDCEEESDDE